MREDDDDVNKENILGVDSCKSKSRSFVGYFGKSDGEE